MIQIFTGSFCITAMSMLNPVDALTNIELVVDVNQVEMPTPLQYLTYLDRSTSTFVNLINCYLRLNEK